MKNKRARKVLPVLLLVLLAVVLAGCAMPQGKVDIYKPEGGWLSWNGLVSGLAVALKTLNDAIARLGIPYSWGWAIIVFTLAVKLVTLPLTLKQLQSTKATQELQPRLNELKQKYGKDRQKFAEEQAKLFKEAGVNPLGGCLPLLIQMPVLFALYRALYDLSVGGYLEGASFFWIPNLAYPDPRSGMGWLGVAFAAKDVGKLVAYTSLPILMVITQVILSKMAQPLQTSKSQQDDQQRMMGQMTLFMPLFLSYIFLGLPSGLSLYYTFTNILSIIQQYFITGWGSLANWIPALAPKGERVTVAATTEPALRGSDVDKPMKRRRRRK